MVPTGRGRSAIGMDTWERTEGRETRAGEADVPSAANGVWLSRVVESRRTVGC